MGWMNPGIVSTSSGRVKEGTIYPAVEPLWRAWPQQSPVAPCVLLGTTARCGRRRSGDPNFWGKIWPAPVEKQPLDSRINLQAKKNGKRGMLGRVGWLLCFYVDVQCFFLTIDVFCAGDFGTILPRTFTSLFGLRWGGELLLLLKFYVPWVCFFWSVASPLDILIKFFVQIAWAPRPSELGREWICEDAYSCKML